ncbi:hypothetical protein BH24ACT22_BH24ACT22_04750 [soil metagenome]
MTLLRTPEDNLRVSVVVPARNEEGLIRACLEALLAQENVAPDEYEVILVLDNCTDNTEIGAREFWNEHPDLCLHLMDGPGKGAGHARRMGMDAACQRLLDLGKPEALISSTDADTVVAPNWLYTQLTHASRGAKAIGGRIELAEEEDLPETVVHWRRHQGTTRHNNLLSQHDRSSSNVIEHWQFSGASLSLSATVYREIGGLEPRAALEDEYLERVLKQRGVPIERPLDVRVTTSARTNGRADRGLARDLALASWYQGNTYRASKFDVTNLLEMKRSPVSLILPGEPYSYETLSRLAELWEVGLLDEVLIVAPHHATEVCPQAIEVRLVEDALPQFGPIRGYGDLLWRGLSMARGDRILALDPGREDSVIERACGLLGPLLQRPELSLVKGFRSSSTPLAELVARPLLNLYHPELSGFVEPLSRDFGARKELLMGLPFPVGAGLDISLLLDAAGHAGLESLAQSCLVEGSEESSSGDSETSYAILAAAASRIPGADSEDLTPGPLFVPGPENLTTLSVPVEERPPLNSLAAVEPL